MVLGGGAVGLARRVLGAVGRTTDDTGEVQRLRELVGTLERLLASRDEQIRRLEARLAALEKEEDLAGSEASPPTTPEPTPSETTPSESSPSEVVEAAPVAVQPPTPRPAPPARPTSSLANAIRSGGQLETSASFRLAPPGSETSAALETSGTADVVLGERYDDEIRTGPEGAYWGPIDNESARARAQGQNLDIDRKACIGCGTCVENIDTVFFLNDDEGKAYVVRQDGSMDRIQDAIDACPVTCIHWL